MEINFSVLRDSAVNNATWVAQEVVKGGRIALDAGVKATNNFSSTLLSLVEKIKSLDFATTVAATGTFFKSTAGVVVGAFSVSAILLSVAKKQSNDLVKLVLNVAGIALIFVGGAAVVRPGINFFGLIRA
jgi:hypothetical protein